MKASCYPASYIAACKKRLHGLSKRYERRDAGARVCMYMYIIYLHVCFCSLIVHTCMISLRPVPIEHPLPWSAVTAAPTLKCSECCSEMCNTLLQR